MEREEKIINQMKQERILSLVEQGKSLIFPERYAEWEKYVHESVAGFFRGRDVYDALEIMQVLENSATIEEAIEILNRQRHSGLTEPYVRSIIFHFSSKGPEFWEATAYGEITPEDKQALEEKKQENIQLIQANSERTEGPKL